MFVLSGVLSKAIPLECYPPAGQSASKENAVSFLTSQDGHTPRFDHLVAIERAGVAQDGGYHSATGLDKSVKIGGIDALFNAAREMDRVFTTGEYQLLAINYLKTNFVVIVVFDRYQEL